MAKKITIIILNWNLPDDTLECLESVHKIDYPNFDVIVVDNASTDDSVEKIKKAYPNITLIENKENLGFAEGNNVALRYALNKKDSDYFFLLNNDCIVDKHVFTYLIDATDKFPNGGVFGPKILYYDDPFTIQAGSCSWCNTSMMPKPLEPPRTPDFLTKQVNICPTFFANGASILISKKALQKAGLFDSRYYLYWEEIDLCERIRQSGFEIYYVPKGRTWHKVSKTSKKKGLSMKFYYTYRNRFLYIKKHLSFRNKFYFFFWRLPIELFSMSRSKKIEKQYYKNYLLGLFHHLKGRYGPLEKKN